MGSGREQAPDTGETYHKGLPSDKLDEDWDFPRLSEAAEGHVDASGRRPAAEESAEWSLRRPQEDRDDPTGDQVSVKGKDTMGPLRRVRDPPPDDPKNEVQLSFPRSRPP